MLSRKEQQEAGKPIPRQWCEQAEVTLYSTYQAHADERKKEFQLHGFLYPNEVFLAASFLDQQNQLDIPTTYIASLDLKENQDSQKILDLLLDSMGIFFDSYFQLNDWNDYVANWTEAEFNKQTFYYKITRENIALTIQAEQLLNQ